MKRFIALCVALVAIAAATASAGQLNTQQVVFKVNAGSFVASDTTFFSVNTGGTSGFGTDTSETIVLANLVPLDLISSTTATGDSAFFFRTTFVASDNDFASGDTLYMVIDWSPDGQTWNSTTELYPLVRTGAVSGGSARTMQQNWNGNLTIGTARVNFLVGAQAIRFRVSHDGSNTTKNRVKMYVTGYVDNGEPLWNRIAN